MLQCTGRISSSLEMPTRFEVKVLFCGGPLKMRWHGGKTMFFWLTFRKVSKISISKLDEDPKKVDIKRCRRNVSSEIVWHCAGYFWQSRNNWRWWLHRLLFTWLVTLSSHLGEKKTSKITLNVALDRTRDKGRSYMGAWMVEFYTSLSQMRPSVAVQV